MLSSTEAFARPVRSVASSLQKSSTAFSMRVLAAAIASFVVAIVVISSSNQSCGGATRPTVAFPSSRHYRRAHALALHHPLDVSMRVHVEHHDGHAVIHAQRNRRRVHHLQVLLQHIAIGDSLEEFRVRYLLRIGVVNPVDARS